MPDPNYITHINYAFGYVNETFDGIIIQNEERLRKIVGLKEQYPDLTIMLSIGGWGSGGFSEMASTEEGRKAFAADCQRIVRDFKIDGIDMDWEYPTSSAAGITSSPEDKDNFTELMKEIRAEIGDNKLLTLTSAASPRFYDFEAIMPYMDFINIMTYDMGTPPYHQSALYPSEKVREGRSMGESLQAHLDAGIPANKLVVGMPFYGRGKKDISNWIDYNQIEKLEGYQTLWDDEAKVPYIVDSEGDMVCTYDNVESLILKCEYILDQDILGAMYWHYGGDNENGDLRKAVYNTINKK
ncbi:MAG: glycoside hydrolase family 18 protein [Tannerellaceae bacterium]|nr:glycoside hydrolase family 18 protein [Tannerellaceae bacterium]